MNLKKSKTNFNNYHPPVLLTMFKLIFLGITFGLLGSTGSDSEFEIWMKQNPVELSIFSDEKTIIFPVESAVNYLLTVPLQIWFIFWLIKRKKIDLTRVLGLHHFDRGALAYSLIAWLILYLVLTVYTYVFQITQTPFLQ